MKKYQKIRPINRPVLWMRPWWQVDLQALPPRDWCPFCGAEIYTAANVCNRCKTEKEEIVC